MALSSTCRKKWVPVLRLNVGFRILSLGILLFTVRLYAQWTPSANAIKLPDSLVFVSTAASNHATLVWHPVNQRYYSLRIGGTNFPLETWLPTGGLSIAQTTCGIDSRGLWYNPTTGLIERNCWGALGWATLDTDASLNAMNTFTSLFTGQLQPTPQSVGAFDPVLNQVLFHSAGTIQVRDRANGAIIQNIVLTGSPATLGNTNSESVIWTGQVGYEIGLLDWATKRVLLFNRATGAFSGQSQLPAVALTHSQFRFCYTNGKVWLFNPTLRKWNAYCIWNEVCPSITLPVEMMRQEVICDGGRARVSWTTASEWETSHFVIERSSDAAEWDGVGQVPASGNSQQVVEYTWLDNAPPAFATVYYRLRQVDLDGREELFGALSMERCIEDDAHLLVMPNPAEGEVHVGWATGTNGLGVYELLLMDMQGRVVLSEKLFSDLRWTTLDLSALSAGTYMIIAQDMDGLRKAVERVVKR